MAAFHQRNGSLELGEAMSGWGGRCPRVAIRSDPEHTCLPPPPEIGGFFYDIRR